MKNSDILEQFTNTADPTASGAALITTLLKRNQRVNALSSPKLLEIKNKLKQDFQKLHATAQEIQQIIQKNLNARGFRYSAIYFLPTWLLPKDITRLYELETQFDQKIADIEQFCITSYDNAQFAVLAADALLKPFLSNSRRENLAADILKNLQAISSRICRKLNIPYIEIGNNKKFADSLAASVVALLSPHKQNDSIYTDPTYLQPSRTINSYKQQLATFYAKKLHTAILGNTLNQLKLLVASNDPVADATKRSGLEYIVLTSLQHLDSQVPKLTHALKNTLQTFNKDNIIGSFWISLPPVIRDMVTLVFKPWGDYYTELANRKEILKQYNKYTYFEKIKFTIKFILPILATFIGVIYLAPMYNDLLVVVVTPILVSFLIALTKEIFHILSKIWDFISWKKEYSTNPRLEAIFTKPNAALIAKFYESRINKAIKKLDDLNNKSIPSKSTHDETEFEYLRKTLEELKKEWFILRNDELEHRHVTDKDARDIFIHRIIAICEHSNQKLPAKIEFAVLEEVKYAFQGTETKIKTQEASTQKPVTPLRETKTAKLEKYYKLAKAISSQDQITEDVAKTLKFAR